MPLTAKELALCASIAARQDELVAQLRDLVAIPSASSNLPAIDHVRAILVARLESLGAITTLVPGVQKPHWLQPVREVGETQPVPPVAICARTTTSVRANILLSGHLDTVHDPIGSFKYLEITSDKSRATGPGCADMKGGLLVAIAALEALEDAGVRTSWTFALNSDEETGSFHSEPALAAACIGHDCALVFEPAMPDGGLVIERSGSGQFMIECTGKSAHVGRDFASGVSAVTELARKLLRLSEFASPTQGRIVSVGPLQGGSTTNSVPDIARAWGNVRFGSDQAMAKIDTDLRSLASSSIEKNPAQTKVVSLYNRRCKPTTPGVLALAQLARAASQDLGSPLPFGATGGVCDGNIFQGQGLPTIDTLGVKGGGLHTIDEWIELDSLVARAQIVAVLISRLSEAGVPKSSSLPYVMG